jgi:hypothetical protein
MLACARDAASCQGLKAEFRLGDLADLGEEGTYDILYTRYLVSQRPRAEAEEMLRRMMSMLEPGGTIVVEDLECPLGDCRLEMDNPAHTRFLELFNALIRDEEGCPLQGLKLPQLLEHAGVASVHCHESPTPIEASEPVQNPAVLVLDSIRQAIVATHLATRTEVDRLACELARFRIAPQNLFWLPKIVQVWGSVPSLGKS